MSTDVIIGRISREEMFMQMAEVAAQRSTCTRAHVGVVITDIRGASAVSLGYNGNARGLKNTCDSDTPGDCGCIHGEVNALLKAPFHQGPLHMYTTVAPCEDCAKLIINSAVSTVYYREPYRLSLGLALLLTAHVAAEHLPTLAPDPQLRL